MDKTQLLIFSDISSRHTLKLNMLKTDKTRVFLQRKVILGVNLSPLKEDS